MPHELGGHEPTLHDIESSDSAASFTVDELLRDSLKTVVGTADQISGQLAFDVSDPSSAQIGIIFIDLRTLTTAAGSRNRALGNQILSTDQYEYISFTDRADQLADECEPGQVVHSPDNW